MQWTHEQSPIIQSKAPKILVRAFAGTGKTTTLVGFARSNPTLRILYLCYNSSVKKAAKGKFPRNVVCKSESSGRSAAATYYIQLRQTPSQKTPPYTRTCRSIPANSTP